MRLRSFFLLSPLWLGLFLQAAPLRAQVTDSQRAAARDLFKEGDALQRSGKLVEALDKFQRAQAVFDAPTNLLRIAECEAALGRLVESAEAFRAVLRAQLPAGSPPAFQAAVDQARGELAQVEPRIPKVVVEVQVQSGKVEKLQLQIDGQNVAAALVGAPLPLDPGTHKISVGAPGYATAEQQVTLKEQESKTASFTLKPAPASATAGGAAGAQAAGGTAASTGAGATSPPGAASEGQGAPPPPPPPIVDATAAPLPKPRPALLLGAHLGWSFPNGQVPLGGASNADARVISGSGLAYGLEGGIRFARQWYGGLILEHADLGSGSANGLDTTVNGVPTGVTGAKASTTEVGAVIGVITNPDKAGFYGEIGLAARWLNVSFTGGGNPSATYTSPEAILGAGVWLPAGRHLRLIPEATLNLGTYNPPTGASALDQSGSTSNSPPGHFYLMVGVVGFYSVDL